MQNFEIKQNVCYTLSGSHDFMLRSQLTPGVLWARVLKEIWLHLADDSTLSCGIMCNVLVA